MKEWTARDTYLASAVIAGITVLICILGWYFGNRTVALLGGLLTLIVAGRTLRFFASDQGRKERERQGK